MMNKVTSKDGTTIAYDQKGKGQPVIAVDGAMCYRSFGPMSELATLLASNFTVITYDRRGRGESSNSKPYGVEREVEDIEALINEAGGSVFLFGLSSGASLAMEAAVKMGGKVKKLAMYEAPYNSEQAARQIYKDYRKKLTEALTENRRGDAVALFMKLVGTPDDQIAGMRQAPVWPMFEAVAPTLAYDAALLGKDRSVPTDLAARVSVPTLVMDGGANLTLMPFMHNTAKALAETIPHARQRTLEGQRHDVAMDVLAPVLTEFFLD
jgi:pimeloyl-ACP methyl ester carboxylesterase